MIKTVIHFIDQFSEVSGRLIAWLTLLMVLVTSAVVILRYLFDMGNIALQESITYMHSMVFMLGAAYTLKHDGHVRVDIFYRPAGEKTKAVINLLGSVLILIPVSAFILYISWEYVATSWEFKEGSQEAGGLEYRYLLKSCLVLMPALLILQGVAETLRSLLTLCGCQSNQAQGITP